MIPAKTQPPLDLLIIDAYYMAYRSYCSTPPLTTPEGFPTGAIHGFLGGLLNIIKETRPKQVVIALEGGGESERSALLPAYKEQRSAVPTPMQQQVDHIWRLCQELGLCVLQANGKEADDVIASLCTSHKDSRKAIFTTDKDIISLVDENTFIVHKEKGKIYYLETSDIKTKWGVLPNQIPEILCFCGDSSDNISGIPGIGIKTATTLIATWGSCANTYANIDKLTPKLQKLLTDHRSSFELSQKLVQMDHSLTFVLAAKPIDLNVLNVLFDSLHMTKAKASWFEYLGQKSSSI